ncbi:hypothetical protein [Streptomyces sp. NPDC048663]|uniref:hypothetical protein n=1 Tax=Streptomyces sp. NPDC048663 TaxID=3155638 RepID=UPI003440CDCF
MELLGRTADEAPDRLVATQGDRALPQTAEPPGSGGYAFRRRPATETADYTATDPGRPP